MRAGTQAFGGPCSNRHLQGATGALLSFVWFSFFRLELGVPNQTFLVRVAAKRASQPRVQFGASAGVLDAPDGHKSLVLTRADRARMDLAAASRLTKQTAPAHCRQRRLARLRREYPQEIGQQSTTGRFAISETHPLIHKKMTHINKQPPSPTIKLCSSTCTTENPSLEKAA